MPEAVDANNVHEDAEIRVEPPTVMFGDSPYTLQTGECGEEGEYIQVIMTHFIYVSRNSRYMFLTDFRKLLERTCNRSLCVWSPWSGLSLRVVQAEVRRVRGARIPRRSSLPHVLLQADLYSEWPHVSVQA